MTTTATAQGAVQITEYYELSALYYSTQPVNESFTYDNRVNFGYGINLSQAATNAAAGNLTLEQDIDSVLQNVLHFTILVSYWKDMLTPTQGVANELNSLIPQGTTETAIQTSANQLTEFALYYTTWNNVVAALSSANGGTEIGKSASAVEAIQAFFNANPTGIDFAALPVDVQNGILMLAYPGVTKCPPGDFSSHMSCLSAPEITA